MPPAPAPRTYSNEFFPPAPIATPQAMPLPHEPEIPSETSLEPSAASPAGSGGADTLGQLAAQQVEQLAHDPYIAPILEGPLVQTISKVAKDAVSVMDAQAASIVSDAKNLFFPNDEEFKKRDEKAGEWWKYFGWKDKPTKDDLQPNE
jgi:hypothetical protein